MADNFQRKGAISNAHVGRDFEQIARDLLHQSGVEVRPNFAVGVGICGNTKRHLFDLGSEDPPVIVECKSHRWTSGNNVPSAKITVWNEAMYYFHCASAEFRKIFFVLQDERRSNGESLASYYLRNYSHLIPADVEIWEYDASLASVAVIHGA